MNERALTGDALLSFSLLTFSILRAYNGPILGMTENMFLPHRFQESARVVRAREPRMKYRLPTDGGPRPLPRGIKGSVFHQRAEPH